MKALELGAGVGLVGIVMALMGAEVVLTDRSAVCKLLQHNANQNAVSCQHTPVVHSMEWGAADSLAKAHQLRQQYNFDCIVAADCIYTDQVGVSPSTCHLLQLCKALCSSHTIVLMAFEARSDMLRAAMSEAADATGFTVARVSLSGLPMALQVDYIEVYRLTPVV